MPEIPTESLQALIKALEDLMSQLIRAVKPVPPSYSVTNEVSIIPFSGDPFAVFPGPHQFRGFAYLTAGAQLDVEMFDDTDNNHTSVQAWPNQTVTGRKWMTAPIFLEAGKIYLLEARIRVESTVEKSAKMFLATTG